MEVLYYYVKYCIDSKFSYEQFKNVLEIIQIIFIKHIFINNESNANEAIELFKDEVNNYNLYKF